MNRHILNTAELLVTYSKDPLYKYYSGVCLVKMNRNASEAESLLEQSLKSAGAVKTLCLRIFYFIWEGRSRCRESILKQLSPIIFSTEQVGKKTSKEYGVAELIHNAARKREKLMNLSLW